MFNTLFVIKTVEIVFVYKREFSKFAASRPPFRKPLTMTRPKMNVPAVQWTMTGGQPLKNTFCLRTAANILFKFPVLFSLALCIMIIAVMISFFRKGTLSSEAGKSVKLHDLQNLGF